MSGNIQGVNLQNLKSEIDEYEEVAKKMHDCISNVCSNMKKLRNYWTGKRINQVINLWNNNCDSINDNTFYFAKNIELILKEIYDQYTSMEAGDPKNSSWGYGWGGIMKVELTDESNIKFDKTNAENITNDINTEISNANTYLNQLITQLDSMQAYSDSLKTLATTYKSNANNIQGALTKVCNNIQTELNDAISDVNTTEGYNEDDAKRAGSTSQK